MRGETQRPAFTKINDNFAEVYGALEGVTTIGQRVDSLERALQTAIPGRNRLINGNSDFWQRATTGTTQGGEIYVADRWTVAALGCTHTVNRGANLPAGGAAPESRRFLNSIVSKTSAGSSAYVAQKIESVVTLSDGEVTVSGFAYGPPGKRIGIRLIQHFGTGGSPSASVSVELGTVAVTAASWTYFQLSARLPSVKGKTLGSNADSDFLWLVVDLCADAYGGVISGQNGEFGIAMLQLERGNRATAFDLRPLAHELQLCQRYYEKSYDNDVVPGTPTNSGRYSWGNSAASGATSYMSVPFKTRKRATPAIVIRPNNNVVEPGYVNQDDSSRTPASVPTIATNVFEVSWGNAPGRWGGWFHWTADAEIY
ncbi:hypothetical protein [Stenotrophomonas maltophilia]|uniref:hypothetical protein n=1 Tax=Stenotrophomonas maltophilia TaxID=40324 RepID=UPI0015DFB52A|nr:hypothetical protein [Stenotrophomonas maltophilia]MBA0448775.1 hypothetical protein [Stenotrophomonas maltophilia]